MATDKGFAVPPGKRDRLAAAYRPSPGGLEPNDDQASSRWSAPPSFPARDSGLVSTVDDVFAFSRLLLRGGRAGNRRLLSEAAVQAMTQDHLTASQRAGGRIILGPGHGWGYGMAIVRDATAEGIPAGAYGWNGGLGTSRGCRSGFRPDRHPDDADDVHQPRSAHRAQGFLAHGIWCRRLTTE